jgi:hypothetical protein
MDRVKVESLRLGCPGFADDLMGREAFEGLQSAAKVIRVDEVGEVTS